MVKITSDNLGWQLRRIHRIIVFIIRWIFLCWSRLTAYGEFPVQVFNKWWKDKQVIIQIVRGFISRSSLVTQLVNATSNNLLDVAFVKIILLLFSPKVHNIFVCHCPTIRNNNATLRELWIIKPDFYAILSTLLELPPKGVVQPFITSNAIFIVLQVVLYPLF